MTTVKVTCPRCYVCGKNGQVEMTEEQYALLIDPNRPHIQILFPTWSPGQREMLISGTHDECWNSMFPPEDDDDEETPS